MTIELIEKNVSDLSGAALDWAVMVCVKGEKTKHEFEDGKLYLVVSRQLMGHCQEISQPFMPSTRWQEGGPLIEKYRVSLIYAFEEYEALIGMTHSQSNESPLVAACHAIVASVLGDTVSVPKELCHE